MRMAQERTGKNNLRLRAKVQTCPIETHWGTFVEAGCVLVEVLCLRGTSGEEGGTWM